MLNSTHWMLQCTETAGNMADTISFSKSVVLSRNDQISPSSPSPIKNLLVGLQSLEPDSILSVPYQQSCTPQLVKKKMQKILQKSHSVKTCYSSKVEFKRRFSMRSAFTYPEEHLQTC